MVIGKCYSKVPLNQNGKLAEVDLPPIEKGCCSITSPSGTEKMLPLSYLSQSPIMRVVSSIFC